MKAHPSDLPDKDERDLDSGEIDELLYDDDGHSDWTNSDLTAGEPSRD